jgi:hypothetical protein
MVSELYAPHEPCALGYDSVIMKHLVRMHSKPDYLIVLCLGRNSRSSSVYFSRNGKLFLLVKIVTIGGI